MPAGVDEVIVVSDGVAGPRPAHDAAAAAAFDQRAASAERAAVAALFSGRQSRRYGLLLPSERRALIALQKRRRLSQQGLLAKVLGDEWRSILKGRVGCGR